MRDTVIRGSLRPLAAQASVWMVMSAQMRGQINIGVQQHSRLGCPLGTLYKLHHRSAAFGEQTGKDTGKVASPGADQGPLLLQKGKEMTQKVLTPDKSVKNGVNLTAEHLQQERTRQLKE